MSDILNLINFFPEKYRTEITTVLTDIKISGLATTIEELASLLPETLGSDIQNRGLTDFLKDMYITTINDGSGDSIVELVLTEYIIGDIDDPRTRLSQERVNNVWNYFIGLSDGLRQNVMNVISTDFRDNVILTNTKNPFKQFAELQENAFVAGLTDLFYTSYAEYLIDAANRYLRVNRHDYQAFGKIVDGATSKPIKNAKITALTTAGISLSGVTYSNFEGFFSIAFTSLTAISSNKNVQIEVEKDNYEPETTSIVYDPTDTYKITTVSLVEESDSSSATISDIKTDLGITIPGVLNTYFTTNGINTLADIRNVGLLRNRKSLIDDLPDNAVLKQFDSLALLELVDPDFMKNNDFIDAGYSSFVDISSTPRSKFVEDHHSILGNDFDTLKYYEASQQLAMTAINEMGQPHDKFNPPPTDDDLRNFDECGCSDCQSAVGPMAYLADLISFATENIETPLGEFDAAWIEDNLYRDFTAIPIDCKELEDSVCQSRIATEVLQGMLASGVVVPSPSATETYDGRVIEYLVESYEAILTTLGTSYDELRNYQTVIDPVERKRYAHRLGIVLEDAHNTGDTITNMYKARTAFTKNDITFLLNYFGLESTITDENPDIPYIPYFRLWKTERLKEVWAERDRKNTGYAAGNRVIIDPDIVTVDDFRFFVDDPVEYDIWKQRRTFIDAVYNDFATVVVTEPPTRIEEMTLLLEVGTGFTYTPVGGSAVNIAEIWETDSLTEISNLVSEISKGSTESITTLWDDYLLKPDAAARLIELRNIEDSTNKELTREELIEAINICTQVVKRAFNDTWINEEVNKSIELSSKMFWISEREPIVGEWPIDKIEGDPFIDPQVISINGLPEITFNTKKFEANSIYTIRQDELITVWNEIGDEASIVGKVNYAYQNTDYKYDQIDPENPKSFVFINNQLNDSNSTKSEEAKTTIRNDLKLSVEDFVYIMALTQSYGTGDVDLKPAEFERLSSILVKPRKIFNYYPSWLTNEGTTEYWQLRKAQLPKWRASIAERNEWKKAFQEHNKTPIIDADLIGPAYLVNPVDDDRAFDLWLQRYNEMHGTDGWYKEISEDTLFNLPVERTFANYKALLDKYIMGSSGVSFYDSLIEREKTESITSVLDQLLISSSQFRFLLDVGKKLDQASFELSEDELNRIYYTLALVQKKKEYYRYTREEADDTYAIITQSPDFFLSRDTDYYTYPPTVPYPLNPNLVSNQQLSDWRKIVSSRTEELERLKRDYKTMLLETDDHTMSFLRDALVEVLDESNNSTSEKARKLGDRLLIDLQDNCCSKTNRVAMAIETLQQLIWKTHTGDIYSEYDLTLSVASFDTVWEWMGSYANWRASMFVFLYPENILLPSLKKESTPAFLDIIGETQNNRNFNPRMACEIVKDYREYLADVSSLELKTTVQTKVVTQKEDKCSGAAQVIEHLTFIFSTAANSGKSYYMAVKTKDEEISQKTFWDNIPNIHDKASIKGSDVYIHSDRGLHYVYVFYLVDAFDMRNKIYAVRYDVNKNEWGSEPLVFEVKKDDMVFRSADEGDTNLLITTSGDELIPEIGETILDLRVQENTYNWDQPKLAISLDVSITLHTIKKKQTLTFTRGLAKDGDTMDDGEIWYNKWIYFGSLQSIDPTAYIPKPDLNLRGTSGKIKRYVFVQGRDGSQDPEILWHRYEDYLVLENPGGSNLAKISRTDTLGFTLSSPKGVFDDIFSTNKYGPILVINDIESMEPKYRVLLSDLTLGISHPFFLNSNFNFAGYNGTIRGEYFKKPFVYQEEGSTINITTAQYNVAGEQLEFLGEIFPLSPEFNEIPAFDNSLLRPELELLREQSENNLLMNTDNRNPKLRIYAEEAYYFAPIMIARKLSDNGYYSDALKWFRLVYDYFASEEDRKIYYGLILEEDYENLQDRIAEWYEDPLNPHAIAATRQNAYTRFTIMSIGSTLLAYANAEFTKDNSESNPRARELYEDIIDLISVLDTANPCAVDEKIRSLESFLDNSPAEDRKWKYKWHETFEKVRALRISPSDLDALVLKIQTELALPFPRTSQEKFKQVQIDIAAENTDPTYLIERVENLAHDVVSRIGVSMAGGKLEPIFKRGRQAADSNTTSNLRSVTGFSQEDLATTNLDWIYTDSEATQSSDLQRNPVANAKPRTINEFAKRRPRDAYNVTNPFPEIRISGMSYLFCVTPNPTVTGILLTAHMNLHKIHNCMNIAGMVRELNPLAAPTDATSGMPAIGAGGVLQMPGQSSVAPTNYRYGFLVERAKQMVSIAQQMESSMLQSLEKFDAESYAQLRAEQDLELAKAGIKLQDLRVKEANSNKALAELQKERAGLQVSGLQGMIDEGLLGAEQALIRNYTILGELQRIVTVLSAAENVTSIMVTAATADITGKPIAAPLAIVAGMYGYAKSLVNLSIGDVQTTISKNSIFASLQRRQQEWKYQKSIASQDVKIGDQQIKISDDRIRIAGQERAIAGIQQDQAKAVLDFLKTKFTNAELYEWMSGVLEDVYSYFLQEATAMSKLAEQQLAFERQVDLPSLIKSDYWNMASNTAMSIGASTSENDRKGLTGSARLLKDLSQLEQYAVDTNQRKLQITKVISLNEHDPVQMEIFRDSGVLPFTTTLRDFDWDYPGHYLRLIRRVSVTVIALTPPNKGIKATLINSGISAVMTNTNNIFQKRFVTRSPESITLSSPYNEYGMFQLDTSDAMYRPFEGSGVETLWELRMEKASNPFDYRSIADVLLTIEYDALENDLYSKTIKNQLNNEPKNESIVLSMRNDLPDQWYELMNPSEDSSSTNFKIRNSDLAPNVLSNSLTAVKAYLSFDLDKLIKGDIIAQDNDGKINITSSIEGDLVISKIEEDGAENGEEGGARRPLNNFLISNLQNFESFPNIEQPIEGNWYVRLTQTTQVLEMIDKKQLRDIIIIFEYSADKVEFPLNA